MGASKKTRNESFSFTKHINIDEFAKAEEI